jgi:hypothetical protein
MMRNDLRQRLARSARTLRLVERLRVVGGYDSESALDDLRILQKVGVLKKVIIPLLKKMKSDRGSRPVRSPAEVNSQGFEMNVRGWGKVVEDPSGTDPRSLVYNVVRLVQYVRNEHPDLYDDYRREKGWA